MVNKTAFRIHLHLSLNTPPAVIRLLRIMVERGKPNVRSSHRYQLQPKLLPQHPFFRLEGWFDLLRTNAQTPERFVSHKCIPKPDTSGKMYQLKYSFGRTQLLQQDNYFELRVMGTSHFEEQDYALFLNWLMPYLAVVQPKEGYMALVQSNTFFPPPTKSRRRCKDGMIKRYVQPVKGDHPEVYYLSGKITDHLEHIL